MVRDNVVWTHCICCNDPLIDVFFLSVLWNSKAQLQWQMNNYVAVLNAYLSNYRYRDTISLFSSKVLILVRLFYHSHIFVNIFGLLSTNLKKKRLFLCHHKRRTGIICVLVLGWGVPEKHRWIAQATGIHVVNTRPGNWENRKALPELISKFDEILYRLIETLVGHSVNEPLFMSWLENCSFPSCNIECLPSFPPSSCYCFTLVFQSSLTVAGISK